jgi:hypothetical protein
LQQRILLILWCSFKLWWNFCLDQNFSYKRKGPFIISIENIQAVMAFFYIILSLNHCLLSSVIHFESLHCSWTTFSEHTEKKHK